MKLTASFQKTLGMLIIVVMSALQMFILFGLIATIIINTGPDTGQTVFSFVFAMIVFAFPLNYGFKLWRLGKSKLIPVVPLADENKKVCLTSKIDLRDYRNLIFRLTYTTPLILYANIMGLAIMFSSILSGNYNNILNMAIGLFLILMPVAVIVQSNKNFHATRMLNERTSYEFDAKNIHIMGETFSSTIEWSSLFKVKELKRWVLLYTGENVANIVSKNSLSSEDMDTLRSFAAYNKVFVD